MYYRGHELFIAKMNDLISQSERWNMPVETDFLTLTEQAIMKDLVGSKLELIFFGGYEKAERKAAFFSPFEWEDKAHVSVLKADYDDRFGKKLSHKDLLGSLMHLGIERDQLGDLIVKEDRLFVFCVHSMAEYICTNLTQIGRHPVSFHISRPDDDLNMEREVVTINVAGTRLDAVVSALAHCSRAKAKMMLKQGFVKVNDIVLDENIQLCNNDFVSIRRTGRFRLLETSGRTRKDRLMLRLEKYI